ncbi:MAG: L-ribulose-5-phosphate 4-epimerase AraD [Planctomycetaceae bacterium]|nr:L-ribulose-5-phosphate 4-epimerase AraD [Planctomycetaceae bacterium]
MHEKLRQDVCKANLKLMDSGLVIETWGNVSGIDRAAGVVAIKPSGVAYDQLSAETMVLVSLDSGKVLEGTLKPSSDTATHLELYRAMPSIGGVVHTHSIYATAWAQARREIPALGTTHADYFYGPVPCTRVMKNEEITSAYELNTGKVIAERMAGLDPAQLPACLVAGHGPFAWGADAAKAVHNAVILEHLARLASETFRIAEFPLPISQTLLDKHFLRKHGPGAYYGQK